MSKWYPNDVQMMSKWYPDDVQMMSKWCPNDVQMMSKWYPNDVQMMSKWSPNDVKIMSKWCSNDVQMISKWCPSDVQIMSNLCPNDVQMMSKWCPIYVQMMSNWCPNDVQFMSKLYPNDVQFMSFIHWQDWHTQHRHDFVLMSFKRRIVLYTRTCVWPDFLASVRAKRSIWLKRSSSLCGSSGRCITVILHDSHRRRSPRWTKSRPRCVKSLLQAGHIGVSPIRLEWGCLKPCILRQCWSRAFCEAKPDLHSAHIWAEEYVSPLAWWRVAGTSSRASWYKSTILAHSLGYCKIKIVPRIPTINWIAKLFKLKRDSASQMLYVLQDKVVPR